MKDSGTSPEYDAFKDLLGKVLSVPREEIMRREAEYRKQSEANPNRRGPKPNPAKKPKP